MFSADRIADPGRNEYTRDCESSSYRVAREYMIRLDRGDLADPDKLRPIAEASGLTPEAFHDR